MVVSGPDRTQEIPVSAHSHKEATGNSPGAAESVGNGVAAHAASMSAIVLPAGRKGSATVPVAIGMTSEQSVSADWENPSKDSLSTVCSNFCSMFARSAVGEMVSPAASRDRIVDGYVPIIFCHSHDVRESLDGEVSVRIPLPAP